MKIIYALIFIVLFTNLIFAQNKKDSLNIQQAEQLIAANKLDLAIDLLEKIAVNSNHKKQQLHSLQLKAKAWQQKGNNLKYLEATNKMLALKDSIQLEEFDKNIQAITAKHEQEQQEKLMLLQQAKIKQQQIIIGSIISTSFLIITFTVLLYKRKQKELKTETDKLLAQQKHTAAIAIIEAEEKERKRIATDLHDGVGQILSAIKMNLSSIYEKEIELSTDDKNLLDKTIALVDESCREVRVVSHNMMPNALLKSGLYSAVKTFIDKIDHQKLQINLHTQGLEKRLPNNIETVLYRVIQEIVNNVIKHAAANRLDIAILKDLDGLSCTIEDNGKGFNTTIQHNGIGIKNIQHRIHFLNGTVEWDSEINKGTLVAIHIPL